MCLILAVSTSTDSALLYSWSIPHQLTSRQARKHHLWNRKESGGAEEILQTPPTPSFSKSYCNTSTPASASLSPSLKSKTKKQALPLPGGVEEINNLRAQEKQDTASLWASCSQSYRKGTIANTRQLLLLLEPRSLLPDLHKRHIPLRHESGRF